jgi:lipoate-protein ligase A
MRWLFLRTPPADGPYNMALDEALQRRAARSGEAVFRVYGWSAPTLSLGRNQRARGCYDQDAARAMGVCFVRRPTGGRALLHHHEVTYSATMPMGDRHARDAYDFINDVLLGGLARLGLAARRATDTTSMPPGLRPCFDVPAKHEIVLNGRKLIGSAQWRRDDALLQHGSILVRDDQPLIARLMNSGAPSAASAAATLAESLGWEPEMEQVAMPILESLEAAIGTCVEPLVNDAELNADVARLHATYEDESWTWRR